MSTRKVTVMLKGDVLMHVIGKFGDPEQVGALVDTLKNSGILRKDIIISAYDEEKFEKIEEDLNSPIPTLLTVQFDENQFKAFIQNVKQLDDENGIVVSVRCAKHKATEVKSVMEQSGVMEIIVVDICRYSKSIFRVIYYFTIEAFG